MMTVDEARPFLDRWGNLLYECVDAGIRHWDTLSAAQQVTYFRRSKASIINDVIVTKARELLDNPPDSRAELLLGQVRVTLEDALEIKFKKLDSTFRPSNSFTQLALNFLFQVRQLTLFPSRTNLIVGYRWNLLETDVRVFVVCPAGKRNAWVYELPSPAAASGGSSLTVIGPTPPTPPPDRVRLKEPSETAAESND